ncbi:PQQ-binding-like beta-propeller repeat protein [Cellulomonas sp. URHE0023]|uniref:outer membrane protein assembly factor BamB family protein n=1 Tax=Cellulomonas sp. URHE0023 TaxID=1380354 RepID=UPI0004885966|nr:PQQ-binding-like beta-propeller repeat protein [Cellulomonas sp. URHE0023]
MTDRMREVELVEGVDEPVSLHPRRHATDGATLADADGGEDVLVARSWARRNARWLLPTAAVAVLVLVGTQLVADARERSRVAALGEIPGVVPPTGPDIGVIWRADPTLATVLQGGTSVGGLLVGGVPSGTSDVDLVALDPDTGSVRWTTPVELPPVHLTSGGSQARSSVSCVPVEHDDRELAGCRSERYGEDIVGLPDSAAWVVDPADGSIISQVVVPGGTGAAFTSHALVVTDRVAADGSGPAPADAASVRWRATATDVGSGETLWTYTTPVVDASNPQEDLAAPDATDGASVESFGDSLVLGAADRAWILADDGRLLRDVELPPGTWIQGSRSGTFIAASYASPDTYDGTLLLPDGAAVPISEAAGWLSVDDGSAPEIVLTFGQGPTGATGFTGRSTTNGDVVWHRDEPVTAGLLLDGVLYVLTGQELLALDAGTGRTRWSTALAVQPQQLSTDGRYLLVPGLGVTLSAFAMGDGALEWTTDLRDEVAGDRDPVYIQGFQTMWHDPRLYVWMDDGAVAVLG